MSWICSECGLENTDDTNMNCYCGFSRDDISNKEDSHTHSRIIQKLDTRITFIKTKYLIVVGIYWAVFFWLGVYFNGGFGKVTDRHSFVMLILGNGGVAIVIGLSLINKKVKEKIVKEGMEFKYGGLIFLFLLMSVSAGSMLHNLLK